MFRHLTSYLQPFVNYRTSSIVTRSASTYSKMSKNVVIVGGHGQVALRLAKLISSTHSVTSIIRSPEHAQEIKEANAKPLILSLEDSPKEEFTKAFQGADVVVWSAGAGGKGGKERTWAVDHDGAIKVFDAIEGVDGKKPRYITVSAIDVRDHSKPYPSHYNDSDKEVSQKYGKALEEYIKAKYGADRALVKRTAFTWTILRPGGLSNEPGVGKASIGRTHLSPTISRDDVAKTLAVLVDREDAAGLAIDLVGGETPIEEGIDAKIKNGETDFPEDY